MPKDWKSKYKKKPPTGKRRGGGRRKRWGFRLFGIRIF